MDRRPSVHDSPLPRRFSRLGYLALLTTPCAGLGLYDGFEQGGFEVEAARRIGDDRPAHGIAGQKRLGFHLFSHDIFVNIVGGIRIEEPGADLGVISAIARCMKPLLATS